MRSARHNYVGSFGEAAVGSMGDRNKQRANELRGTIQKARGDVRSLERTFHYVLGSLIREWSIFAYTTINALVVELALVFLGTLFPLWFFLAFSWSLVFQSSKWYLIIVGLTIIVFPIIAIGITYFDRVAFRPSNEPSIDNETQHDAEDNPFAEAMRDVKGRFVSKDHERHTDDDMSEQSQKADHEASAEASAVPMSTGRIGRMQQALRRLTTYLRRVLTKQVYVIKRNYWYYAVWLPAAYVLYLWIRIRALETGIFDNALMRGLDSVVNWILGVAQDIASIIPVIFGIPVLAFWTFIDHYWMPVFATIGLFASIFALVTAYRRSSPDRVHGELTLLGHAVRFMTVVMAFVLIALVVAIGINGLSFAENGGPQ